MAAFRLYLFTVSNEQNPLVSAVHVNTPSRNSRKCNKMNPEGGRGERKLTYIIPQPNKQAGDAQAPEDEPQRLGHAQLRG